MRKYNISTNKAFFAGGSPIYWSYEQGKAFESLLENSSLAFTLDLDSSIDIYSFGLILKEMIYDGVRPWRFGHRIDHVTKGENKYYSKRLLEKAVRILDEIADKCLQKK